MIVSILTMQMLLIVTQHHYIVLVLCRHLNQCLTHCGLMMPYGDIDTWSVLAQVMTWCRHGIGRCWLSTLRPETNVPHLQMSE